MVESEGAKCRLHPLIYTSAGIYYGTRCSDKSRRVYREKKAPRQSVARIEGPVKSPLTTTENHCGQPEEAYGDLGLKSPFFTLRRIGNVTQICQYEKPPFLTIKFYSYPMGLLVITVETSDRKEASMALLGEKGDHFNLNWGGSKEGGLSVDYIP